MAEKAKYWVSLKLILRRGDEVLGLLARNTGEYSGFYDFPGGRIHIDELAAPFHDVLNREVQEEIGEVRYRLHPAPVAIGRHVTKNGDAILYVFFIGDYESGEPMLSHEHEGSAWLRVDPSNLEKYFTSGILEGVRTYLSSRTAVKDPS
ncbi:NUDIX hydrolase [Patescibacteria group bacterium]|nr:MAG: NUDIX hydrolase [Patescibacteria group bacterium]